MIEDWQAAIMTLHHDWRLAGS